MTEINKAERLPFDITDECGRDHLTFTLPGVGILWYCERDRQLYERESEN